MEIEFKFKIGQTVFHTAAATWEAEEIAEGDRKNWPRGFFSEQRWFIIERMTQECPGGVQKHYVCRGVSRSGGVTKEFFKFNEIELEEVKNGK